jgi:hypothetical protein
VHLDEFAYSDKLRDLTDRVIDKFGTNSKSSFVKSQFIQNLSLQQ